MKISSIRFLMSSSLIMFFISCSHDTSKKVEGNKFYTEKGEWDSARIPFIKPYEAILLDKESGWFMNLKGDDGDSGFNNIKKATVANNLILAYSVNSIFNGVDIKETWRIIIPSKGIEKAFDNYPGYLNYLNKLGITSEPKLIDIEKIAAYYASHDMIDWQAIE